ncbi:AAA-ATPase At5g57480-like [Euphorbia lathyris]|uniref:AAA-ATPase At5g57480-like n=1 Tax=Euphorbia lathyris TaxID=212925 RepID=UPI003313F884
MEECWTSLLGVLASQLGVLAFFQSLLQVVFPPELRFASLKLFNRVFNAFSTYCYFDITEIDGVNTNELYNAVQLYLSSFVSISGSRLSLTRALNSSAITFGLTNNDTIFDTFNGVTVHWEHVVTQRQAQTFSWRPLPEEKRGFTLRIKKKDKSLILDSYLNYIMEKSNDIRRRNQDRLLYTNSRGGSLDSRGHPWESVPFKHLSTFDTLAMDPAKKKQIMEDLMDFAHGQAFYQKTGRAWKRGYLLYGGDGGEETDYGTTNHIEKLDPALLRSGRMDMHIFMSYCSYPSLKILLKNYLEYGEDNIEDVILKELENTIDDAEMTPADISEVLIKN